MRFRAGVSMLLFAMPLAAQSAAPGPTDPGSMLIAGSASLVRTSVEGSSATTVSLQPSLLYFVSNRVAIGGEVGLGYTDHESGNSSSWRLGPAARLYFGPSTAKTLPYLGAAVLFGSASFDSDAAGDSDASVWGVEGVAGLTFMISPQVGIAGEAFVSRNENSFDAPALPKVTTKETAYGLRFGVAAFIF